jgi:uncharacterized membrane protein
MSDFSPGSGIAIGMSLGLVFGVLFDNIPLGLVCGAAIGAVFEAASGRLGAAEEDEDDNDAA